MPGAAVRGETNGVLASSRPGIVEENRRKGVGLSVGSGHLGHTCF